MRELDIAEIKSCELDILKAIHAFCEENNLHYFLWGGTLLGAIRHKGFIPWDDDIDIAMPRSDFEYFIHHFKMEHFACKSCETHADYPYVHAKAYDERTKKVEYILEADRGLEIGIDVDVFPIDQFPENQLKKSEIRFRHLLITAWLSAALAYKPGKTFSNRMKNLMIFIGRSILHISPNRIARRVNHMAMRKAVGEAVIYADFNVKKPLFMKNEWFAEYELHPFEDGQFYVPKEYDAVLRRIYGDYMQLPPEEERVPHHCFHAYAEE